MKSSFDWGEMMETGSVANSSGRQALLAAGPQPKEPCSLQSLYIHLLVEPHTPVADPAVVTVFQALPGKFSI